MKFNCRIQVDARLIAVLSAAAALVAMLLYGGGAAAAEQVKGGGTGAALLAVGLFLGRGRGDKGPGFRA
jgi:hypothetical protein